MKVMPSSATCGRCGFSMSINCGMNAPKNTSTFGFESSTRKPCRKKPPRGGGGGFGNPQLREPDSVAYDAREGYITAQEALEIYKVVLTPEFGIDFAGTAALRARS
mgnify:CR=1 FL=1